MALSTEEKRLLKFVHNEEKPKPSLLTRAVKTIFKTAEAHPIAALIISSITSGLISVTYLFGLTGFFVVLGVLSLLGIFIAFLLLSKGW
jgi:hypothetical protein